MTTFIVDEKSSQTPIGELLQQSGSDVIEIRNQAGVLLGTLLMPAQADDDRYAEAERIFEAEADLIRERMARPPSEGLTTAELLKRLHQRDGSE